MTLRFTAAGFLAAGLLCVACCLGQTPDTPQPKFLMADVHVSTTSHFAVQAFGGVLRNGKYIDRDETMLQLITGAYGVEDDNIAGGPGWLSSDLFDIIAKVPDGTTPATAKLMVQALLADRFRLVIGNETRPLPRYVLSVADVKGGAKLKTAAGTGAPSCQPKPQAGGPRGPGPVDPASLPNIIVECRNVTSADIATNLRQMAGGYLDHAVIDSTKLEGPWDFDIEWTGRGALAAKGADGISIFDAVTKQLGLKLALENVPLPSLAIVSVNRKPTDNAPGVAAQLAEAPARFEAASVKPVEPDKPPFRGLLYTGGSQMRAGGTLREMIAMSLRIPPNVAGDTLLGLPKFADTDRWDITAKVPSTGEGALNVVNGRPQPPPLSVGLEMLHGVMIDSFELKTHTENREVTVYALVLGSGKPKMTKAEDSERSGCNPDPSAPKPFTNIPGPMMSCKNTSMADLTATLQQQANAYIDHPIVDATGLEGGWDFLIGWTPKQMMQAQPAPNPNQPPGAAADVSDPGGISAFDAVEKELGLKLVKRTQSIPVIVVDHVDEKPLE
jgi:uncharacterized protein (TIGR03435 family)